MIEPEDIKRLRYDLEFYALNCLTIREYDSPRTIPFRFNEAQQIIYSKILKAKAEKRPVKHVILKARKMGVTTFYDALGYHTTSTNKLTDGMVVAHDEVTAIMIFDKVRMFYDLAPAYAQPMRKVRSRKELRFENPTSDEEEKRTNPGLLSTFAVGTAGSREIMRGGTLTFFHGSEVAFWGKNASKQMLGVINSIPDHDPRTIVALESTANGPSGYFYDVVMKAYKDPENSAYELIFLPWHIFDKYRIALEPREKFKLQDDHEEQLRAKGIKDDQLKWRRWAIKHKCDDNLNFFRQEYPSTPEEAFMFTGRTVFSQERLMVFIQGAPEFPPTCTLQGLKEELPSGITLEDDPKGEIKVFAPPQENVSYCMGVDVSEGIDISEDDSNPDPDYTWFNISRRDNMKQVLSWRTKIDPDYVGPAAEALAYLYNMAWINVEANNHGIVPCNYLKKNYPLYRLYLTIRVDHITDKHTEIVGFRTSSATKAYLISEGRKVIRDNDCFIFDKVMIHELTAYRQDARGRYSGDGSHDDGVIAFCLTNICRIYSHEVKPRNDTGIVAIPTAAEMRKFDPAYRPTSRLKRQHQPDTYFLGNHRNK